MKIPKVFHTIWVQGELPDEYVGWFESWKKFNPDWEHILWKEADWLDWIINREIYDTAVNHAQRAEIVSKEILYRHGGVFVDADFQCLKPFTGLFEDDECFTAEESAGQISAGIVGSVPGHQAMADLMAAIPESIRWQRETGRAQNHGAGPMLLQRVWRGRVDVTVYPSWMFYPYNWNQKDPGFYGEAYAVHHWKATWKD